MKLNKTGFTLVELMVTISIMAILAVVMIPAAKALISSFETTELITEVIGAALENANALAMNRNKYAGIRFQQDLKGRQYMILIIADDTGLMPANGFKAVEGRKPMKLPASIGVMDLKYSDRVYNASGVPDLSSTGTKVYDITSDAGIASDNQLNDATTFSIVFAPSGKLATRQVWVRNKDGLVKGSGNGDIFNVIDNVEDGIGKFLQDDHDGSPTSLYPSDKLGFGFEDSRKSFIIYEKSRLKAVPSDSRYTDYLEYLDLNHRAYVNPFSGQITN